MTHQRQAKVIDAKDGWLPIETAPMDGTDVDLRGTSKFGDWELNDTWAMNGEWYHLGPTHTPTHWKPLPEGPAE